MKPKRIAYWLTTILICLALISGGIGELLKPPAAVQGMARLGYPAYVMTILGVWKLLGAFAILIPRFPRLKEWAYAG
ncbi:MAG TPA: DoxX family protein, partial [Polyangiaceae bacterium]|nr:DoxX family protein [Polyangiaceae bacterium]